MGGGHFVRTAYRPGARGTRYVAMLGLAALALVAAVVRALPADATTTTFSGTVSATGTAFVSHMFNVTRAGPITVSVDWDTAANLNVFLKDPTGAPVAQSTSKTAKPETLTY